jgi:ribosomal protein S18 acetylase RimI-like enzyme
MLSSIMPEASSVTIRRATPDDAAALVALLEAIASERVYTAIDEVWSVDTQRRYLAALSPRACVHVAETPAGELAGYQVLDLWAPTLHSMAHAGQIGTFLAPAWRGRGVGRALFVETLAHARRNDFAKFIVLIRASNAFAQSFYRKLGFSPCGLLKRQVRIGGVEDDEIVMELFL